MWTLGGCIGQPHLKRLFLHLLLKVWKLKPTYPNAFGLRGSSDCNTTVTATKTSDATILETTSGNANATEQKQAMEAQDFGIDPQIILGGNFITLALLPV